MCEERGVVLEVVRGGPRKLVIGRRKRRGRRKNSRIDKARRRRRGLRERKRGWVRRDESEGGLRLREGEARGKHKKDMKLKRGVVESLKQDSEEHESVKKEN